MREVVSIVVSKQSFCIVPTSPIGYEKRVREYFVVCPLALRKCVVGYLLPFGGETACDEQCAEKGSDKSLMHFHRLSYALCGIYCGFSYVFSEK